MESIRSGDWVTQERIRAYAFMLLAFTIGTLLALWTTGAGLLDAWGRPLGTDFSSLYTAGRLALAGRAELAYDFASHHAEQRRLFGGGADLPFYSWFYPPVFFLLTAPLAALPYVPALLAWLGASLAFYLAAIRSILPQRLALLSAAAFPAVLVTFWHGQNAFLTAALLACGLNRLERSPWIAGLFLGALCYKPHLGLVVPVVLLASGNWRAFLGASAAVAGLVLASLAFGTAPWIAFIEGTGTTATVMLEDLSIGWFKMQTLFAAVRGLGGPLAAAYALQALLTAALVAALAWTWRARPGRSAKAATCVAALIATPFSADYDMAVLAAAIAFLVSDGLERGFLPYEKTLLALIWFLPLFARPVANHLGLPIGFLGMAALFAFAIAAAHLRGQAMRLPEGAGAAPARARAIDQPA